MGRTANISPLGLYNWDNTIFDLMVIPTALDKPTLINNLLAETAELEVLYPNPIVFKNLLGVWSAKNLDVWNRLYATTQYEYNPIENYNRYETGSDGSTGRTTHSGTDTTTETTTHGGTDRRTESIATGGKDTLDMTRREGGTQGKSGSIGTEEGGTQGTSTSIGTEEGGTQGVSGSTREGGTQGVSGSTQEGGTQTEATNSSMTAGGSDTVAGTNNSAHYIAGFDSAPSGANDGLVKQSRDDVNTSSTTTYGKTETGTGSKTTTFGKTETESETTTFGKTVSDSETTTFGKTTDTDTDETITFGKTTDTDTEETITFGKTETNKDETTYGKTESVTESRTYGQTIGKSGSMVHGEQVATSNEGEHELHAHGNIGVTTTQQLIKEQRAIELFNLYDIIIEDFKMRFCILIY